MPWIIGGFAAIILVGLGTVATIIWRLPPITDAAEPPQHAQPQDPDESDSGA